MKEGVLTTAYDRPMRVALIVGIAAGLISLVGFFVSGAALFFQAYLFAFCFWISASLGSLGFLELHFLVGSRWGLAIRRILEAAAGNIGFMAILFIPLLFGLTTIFPWAKPGYVPAGTSGQFQTFYLNLPFFVVRAVLYFVIWTLLAVYTNRLSARRAAAAPGETALQDRLRGLGAAGLILYFVTASFAIIDWVQSLQPHWGSAAYGLIMIFGQVLTALSLSVMVLNLLPGLSLGKKWTSATTPIPYKDLGALLLTLVMGWAYLFYFQMLIIWAGNLPREAGWYLDRMGGGWLTVGIFVVIFQFVIPFGLLISMRVRHNLRMLAWLGGILCFTFMVNMFWQIKPAFSPGQFSISWLDIVVPVAMGGLWVAAFLRQLKRRPALTEAERATLAPASEQHTELADHTSPG
jgi:hypothetical protein